MKLAVILVVACAVVVGAHARMGVVVPDANVTAAAPKFTKCGFLGLSDCESKKVNILCRCKKGCSVSVRYALGSDRDEGNYCFNGVYNYGDWCDAKYDLRFKKSVTLLVDPSKKVYINGRGRNVGTSRKTYTTRVKC